MPSAANLFGLSALGKLRVASENNMKKATRKRKPASALRQEYDLSSLKGGVRGKYFERYQSGTNLFPKRTVCQLCSARINPCRQTPAAPRSLAAQQPKVSLGGFVADQNGNPGRLYPDLAALRLFQQKTPAPGVATGLMTLALLRSCRL